MGEYRRIVTNNPPVLREKDGKLTISISHGDIEIEAEIGVWFTTEFINRVIIQRMIAPQLKKQHHVQQHNDEQPDEDFPPD